MKGLMGKGLIALVLLGFFAPLQAELYRWTDSDGKVHYSDRKPNPDEAPEVEKQELKSVNIDTSSDTTRAMRQVFPDRPPPKDTASDAEKQRRQAQIEAHCREAKRYLRDITGPVQFLDEDGNMMDVSERERKAHQAEMEKYVKEHCS